MGLTNYSTGGKAMGRESHVRKHSADDRVIAIAGNPSVGKSTLFNALTGLKQHTGNWPGKTVVCAQGECIFHGKKYLLVDIPGTYSLTPHSAEEQTARDFLCSGRADAVVVVCDASCLQRSLRLVLQTMELTSRIVVCVNLIDEAEKRKIYVDTDVLSRRLGVLAVAVSARARRNLNTLLEAVERTAAGENDRAPVCAAAQKPGGYASADDRADALISTAEDICREAVSSKTGTAGFPDWRLDRLLTGRLSGYPLMLLLLLFLLWLTITGANYPSQLLEKISLQGERLLTALFHMAHAPEWLYEMLVSGVYRVVSSVISVMLPPMAIFFPLFTLLEDVGYLPRVAFNLDRPFQCCHACGKQALTMAMGFGCNAAGVVGCRIIDSPRERLLAVLTNSFVPCNGRFPLLISMITIFFAGTSGGFGTSLLSALLLTAVILIGVGMTFLSTWLLSVTILRGVPSAFTLELPPYRKAQIGSVIIRSVCDRALFVLGRAAAVAVPAGLLIWLAANVAVDGQSLLMLCASFLDPFARLMGLDGVILIAFVLGFPANEIVMPIILMAYLSQGTMGSAAGPAQMKALLTAHGWTWMTAVSMMLFSLMHWPCSTTLLTVRRETGSWKLTGLSALLPTVCGILSCILFTAAARLFPI